MNGAADATVTAIAPVETSDGPKAKRKSPFEITDYFCTAPLAVLDDTPGSEHREAAEAALSTALTLRELR